MLVVAIALGLHTIAAPRAQTRAPSTHAPRAKHFPSASIRITDAWVRAAPPYAMMLAGYMTLRNDGAGPVRMVSAESVAFGSVAAHRTVVEDGISRMRPAGEVSIPAYGSVHFGPGGLHLMLMQPTRMVKLGDVLHFRLRFSDGGIREVEFPVRAEAPSVRQ